MFFRKQKSWYRQAAKTLFFSYFMYRFARFFLNSVSREPKAKKIKKKK